VTDPAATIDANRKAKAAKIALLLYGQGADHIDAGNMDQIGRDVAAKIVGKDAPSDETWAHVVRILHGIEHHMTRRRVPLAVVEACSRCGKVQPLTVQPCWTCRDTEQAVAHSRRERRQIIDTIAQVGRWPSYEPATDAEMEEAGR
jgi:hypothetical protein